MNGFTRKNGDVYIWLAKRALSKPTYPGLLDQIAAGGLPAKTSLLENAKREAAERPIPRDILDGNLRAAGCVSYRYAARRGLSTKTLAVFDLELPEDLVPINGDGEVDAMLMKAEDAVESLRSRLYEWKPNSALVMLDFAMRWGYISPDDPDYIARHDAGATRPRRDRPGPVNVLTKESSVTLHQVHARSRHRRAAETRDDEARARGDDLCVSGKQE